MFLIQNKKSELSISIYINIYKKNNLKYYLFSNYNIRSIISYFIKLI